MKVYTKKKISKTLAVIECPDCKSIIASASAIRYLPDWAICTKCNGISVKTIERKK